MRIMHVSDHFHPWMGYQETYLAREHTKMGHDVLVITANRYGRRPGTIAGTREAKIGLHNEEGIAVQRLPILFELPTVWAYPWIVGLIDAIREFSPDVVHCHGITSFSNIRVANSKKEIGFGLVIDNHAALFNVFHPDEPRVKHLLKAAIHRGYARTFGRILIKKADAIVAIGEPEKEYVNWLFRSLAPDNIPIIRLGADQERFQYCKVARNQVRDEQGWTENEVVLGHAGTIFAKKGIDPLLDAIAKLPPALKRRCVINIVGKVKEDYLPRMQKHASNVDMEHKIVLTDFVEPSRLADIISAWDIAVWAGDISNTAIEAMSVSRPIIACRTPYTEYIIEQFNAGLLVERDNIEELSSSLSVLIENQVLRKELGHNARLGIEKELNWQKIAADFIQIYEKVVPTKESDYA